MQVKFLIVTSLVLVCAALVMSLNAAPLELDASQSKVEVAVSCTADSFVGHLEKFQATIECDPAAPLPSKADVSFSFGDLKTGNQDRDAAMLKWLEFDSTPTASFHLTNWGTSGGTNMARGELKIHDVTVALQMPVVVQHDANAWDVSGQAVIDYKDFKLPKIRKALVLTVHPKLKVKFHLVGKIDTVK
jgi:polyisoprenoid-binding protein YceI